MPSLTSVIRSETRHIRLEVCAFSLTHPRHSYGADFRKFRAVHRPELKHHKHCIGKSTHQLISHSALI